MSFVYFIFSNIQPNKQAQILKQVQDDIPRRGGRKYEDSIVPVAAELWSLNAGGFNDRGIDRFAS